MVKILGNENSNRVNKLKLIKEKFVECSQSSTSHGYPNIFRSDKLGVKIFWFLLLMISLSLCSYLCTTSVLDFMKFETNSKMSLINEAPMSFPEIKLCHSNAILKYEAIQNPKANEGEHKTDEKITNHQSNNRILNPPINNNKVPDLTNSISNNLNNTSSSSLSNNLNDLVKNNNSIALPEALNQTISNIGNVIDKVVVTDPLQTQDLNNLLKNNSSNLVDALKPNNKTLLEETLNNQSPTKPSNIQIDLLKNFTLSNLNPRPTFPIKPINPIVVTQPPPLNLNHNNENLNRLWNISSILSNLNASSLSSLNQSIDYDLKNALSHPSVDDSVKKSLGFTKNEFFIEIKFNGKNLQKNLDTYIKWFYDFDHGNCFKFNSGLTDQNMPVEILKQEKPGTLVGFHAVLFADIPSNHEKNKLNFNRNLGLKLSINNQSYLSQSDKSMLHIKTGTCTYIQIKKIITIRLPHPYSDCITEIKSEKDTKYYEEFAKRNKTYQQTECFQMCLQSFIIENCKCRSLELISVNDTSPICSHKHQTSCAFGYIHYRSSNESDLIRERCRSECPMECEMVSYEWSTTYDSFPNPGKYSEHLKKNPIIHDQFLKAGIHNISHDDLTSSLACVLVYYDELRYSLIEDHSSKDIIELLAALGGTIGLFIGISLLSFCEIIEFFIEVLYILCQKKSRISVVKN